MQRNFAVTRNVNVELPVSVYECLVEYKRHLRVGTWLSFFRHVMSPTEEAMIYVDFLRVNDGPKESCSIVFILGDNIYHWDTKGFKHLNQGEALRLIAER